jgi:diguanylate cyclase (GGDEF)-like protein
VGTIADGECRDAELYLRHKAGHRVSVSVRVAPIMDTAGRISGAIEVFSDITAKQMKERRAGRLEVLAFRDALTGVSNRRFAELKVKQAIQEFEQFGRNVGLVVIDVDNLKKVNNAYGHSIGDVVLRAVCSTLTNNLRRGDTVGRLSSEEFLVIAADVNSTALVAYAERCRMLIAESVVPVRDEILRVTVSSGATLIRKGDTDHLVLKRASELMHQSKRSGRNRTTLG